MGFDCASFGAMNLTKWAVDLFQQHPWAVSFGLVILATALTGYMQRLWSSRRRRKASAVRLRNAEEQAHFEPVKTVYAPRGYRRWRGPR